MKAKEYTKQFITGDRLNREGFRDAFALDFEKAIASRAPEAAIFEIKTKYWNAINGTGVTKETGEKFWSFLYATVIVPITKGIMPSVHGQRPAKGETDERGVPGTK
jgi:hypothetical protein